MQVLCYNFINKYNLQEFRKKKGRDCMDIIQLISNVGFPIVACLCMGWYVKDTTDKQRAEIQRMNDQHSEDIEKMSEALNNNTLAVRVLCEKLEVERSNESE